MLSLPCDSVVSCNNARTLLTPAERAENLVLMGEVSSVRHALDGEPVAPGTQRTRDLLSDPMPEVLNYGGDPFHVGQGEALEELARRGAAVGPSGMTPDLMKHVLEHHLDSDLFHNISQLLVRAAGPSEIFSVPRIGRLTALQNPQVTCCDDWSSERWPNSWGLQLSVPLPYSSTR